MTLTKPGQNAFFYGILRNCIPVFFLSIIFLSFSASLPAQSYRTKASGNWNALSTWESSVAGIVWIDALAVPSSSAGIIYIRSGHSVVVTDAETMNKVEIWGTLQLQSGSMTVNNQLFSDGEIKIHSGGQLLSNGSSGFAAEIKGNSPKIIVETGGKIKVGNGGSIASDSYSAFATGSNTTWKHNSIFEWNSTTPLPIAGAVFFPGVAAGVKPRLVLSNTGALIGGAGNTTINGLLLVENSFSIGGAGTKTIRDGIAGSGTLTLAAGSGAVNITGTGAVLGGRNLILQMNRSVAIGSGLTIPTDSSVIVRTAGGAAFTGKGSNAFTVNGSIDMGTVTIENTAGAVHINGIFKTGHAAGLEAGSITASSIVNVNTGSTVEYNAAGDQQVTATNVLEGSPYYNIVFSGSGVKSLAGNTPVSSNVKIMGTAVVDAVHYNLGSASAGFTMENGRLQLGQGGLQPQMAGTYNLNGGSVQFARNGSSQLIRSGSSYVYKDIEIAGDQVSSEGGNDIYMRASAIFTIKSTGTYLSETASITGATGVQAVVMESGAKFYCTNESGFYGTVVGGKSPAVLNNIENISLATGSTFQYGRLGDQVISTGVVYQNLVLSGSGNKTPGIAGVLQLRGNLIGEGNARFIHNNGMVEMTGSSAAQTYTAMQPFVFYTLKNNNPVNFIVNADFSVEDALLFGATAKLSLNNGNIHMKSVAAKTAQVGPYANAAISYTGGYKFYIERFIKTPGRWHLLSIPVQDVAQTLQSAWAEGQNAGVVGTAGLGTNITGPAGPPAFDFASAGYSLKYWDVNLGANGAYRYVSKKDTALANPYGYYLYVRGDRQVLAAGPFGPTTLRTSGKLLYNPSVSLIAGKFCSVGNPLASAVDLRQLNYSGDALSAGTVIYLWDPALSGNYSNGGYQTLTYNGADFIITPGGTGGSAYPEGGSSYNVIESGQAFFIKDPEIVTISFPETAKITGSATVSRGSASGGARIDARLFTAGNGEMLLLDGTAAELDGGYSNAVDAYDAEKLDNSSEAVSFYRGNKKLVVERHNLVYNTDSFFLRTDRLKKREYNWNIHLSQLEAGLTEAWLVDTYRNTRTSLQLGEENIISFVLNDSAASAAAMRFYIIMKAVTVLPVNFMAVNAQRAGNEAGKVAVRWEVANELNLDKYQVERSINGSDFYPVASMPADNLNKYSITDAAVPGQLFFYRIVAISRDGSFKYSKQVVVDAVNTDNVLSVYPNPVQNKTIRLSFNKYVEKDWVLQLSNMSGQMVYTAKVQLNNAGELSIDVKSISTGVYNLRMIHKSGESFSQVVLMD